MAARKKRAKPLTKERILEELSIIAFARLSDYLSVGEKGLCIKHTEDLPPGCDAAISSIENSSSGMKVKFYDKMKALELLGKTMGLFDGGEPPASPENNLLEAILQSTDGDLDTGDVPELGGRGEE